MSGLRLALTTLTVAPVRGPDQVDRRTAGRAMELAPLVGLGIGLAAATVLYLGRVLLTDDVPLLPCALAVSVLALATRGLHLDGLADLTDGLASYRDPAGARDVMKAPDVGPMGVAAVVLTLLVQVGALLACVQHGRGTASLLLAVATGRLAVTAACRVTPAATPDGLGALVARTVRAGVPTAWTVGLCVVASGYALVDPDTRGSTPGELLRPTVAVLLALLACRGLRAHAVRRVGGLTGDVLGALVELATTVVLIGCAAAPSLS